MSSICKSDILKIFKAIHKTRKNLFQDHYEALDAVRQVINESFQKNKGETNPEKIKEMYNEAILVEEELRTKFIQAVEVKPGRYKVRISPDHCVDDIGPSYSSKIIGKD